MMKFFKKLGAGIRKIVIPILISFIIFLILTVYLTHNIFYTIMSGEAGVRWMRFRDGTKVDYIYPEGMHAILPWDKMYIYNVRIRQISPEIDVLTKNGLQVHLFLSIRYAPKYKLLGLLHKKIGPDYVNTVIIPEIEAVLREVIGTMGSEQIYTTGRAVIVEAINLAIERVAQRYIDIDGVLIKRIELPKSVAEAIRYKIEQKQMVEAHKFIVQKEKIEAQRKRVEGEGIRDQFKIIASSIPEGKVLEWMGIKATLELSKSNNSKVVVIGAGNKGLPLIGTIPMMHDQSSSSEAIPKAQPPDTAKQENIPDTSQNKPGPGEIPLSEMTGETGR
ncbi:MAG: prohibitin family protein [Deltaproteobacteria bacterium]|nr:MAG: prohibitin family protein [Deltaproteobacteria bacterium]